MVSQINKIILKSLSSGDKYGLEIIKDIEEFTSGRVVLKQPSLYSALRRMEKKGYISSFWEDSEIGGRRHYYSLTNEGKTVLKESTELNDADIASILAEIDAKNSVASVDKPIAKQNTAYEKFDPHLEGINSQSFSQQIKSHTEPTLLKEKVSPKIAATEEQPKPESAEKPAFWRESLAKEQSLETEFKFNDESKNDKLEINYKDILGELDADRPTAQNNFYTSPTPQRPAPKAETKPSEYSKQVSEIFSKKYQANAQSEADQKFRENLFNQQNQNTIDEINRRYNLNGQKNSNYNNNRLRPTDVEITEYNKNNAKISNSQKEFVNINKLNLTRAIIMTTLFLAALLASFFVFDSQQFVYGPHKYVYWVAMGLTGAYLIVNLIVTLMNFNKKIQLKKMNWPINLFYRSLLVIVLFTFVIALCLCIGMTSLAQVEYFTLWYVPTLAIASILVSWLVGITLYAAKLFRE